MSKISELPAIDPATITGAETVPAVKDGQTGRATISELVKPFSDAAAASAAIAVEKSSQLQASVTTVTNAEADVLAAKDTIINGGYANFPYFETIAGGIAGVADGELFQSAETGTMVVYARNGAAVDQVASLGGGYLQDEPILLAFSGQSNAVGTNAPGGTKFPTTDKVKMFDLGTRAFRDCDYSTMTNPDATLIPHANGNNNQFYAAAHRIHLITGRPVYIVPSGAGGQRITARWTGAGALSQTYVTIKTAIEEALVILGKSTIDAFFWAQGESDSVDGTWPDYWTELKDNLIDGQLKQESWWSDTTQFIAVECPYYHSTSRVNPSLRRLNVNGDAFTKCVSANGILTVAQEQGDEATNSDLNDQFHWSGQSLYRLGLRVADAFVGGNQYLALPVQTDQFTRGIANYRHFQETPLGEAFIIDPLGNANVSKRGAAETHPAGGNIRGQTISDTVNCAVTILSDGRHSVLPGDATATINGNTWSYVCTNHEFYKEAGTQSFTVSGVLDTARVDQLTLKISQGNSATFYVAFTDGNQTLDIDWGDGTTETALADATNHSHTYAAVGNYTVKLKWSNAAVLKQFRCTDGELVCSTSDFKDHQQMILLWVTGAGSLMGGDIADLPDSISNLDIKGNNTVFGDIAQTPSAMQTMVVHGNNRISGSVNGLTDTCATLNLQGENTVFGSPESWNGMNSCQILGNNTVNANGTTMGRDSFALLRLGGAARTTAQVDALIQQFADVGSPGTLDLNEPNNAARSAASDAAVTTITGNGGTVQTTP